MARVTRLMIVLSLVLAFLVASAMPFANEDLFLAFCAGRATLGGLLDRPDQWSFTTHGTVWVDQSWLSHLIYYLSYEALGDWGPVLIKILLLASTLGLLYLKCRGLGVSPGISLIALTLGTLSLAPFLKIRAENFGMMFFVLTATFITAGPSWGRFRQAGALCTLALWSNAHGSFMLGFCLIGLKCLLELLRRAGILPYAEQDGEGAAGSTAGRSRPFPSTQCGEDDRTEVMSPTRSADPWGWFLALVLAMGVMALLNPYGLENLTIPFRQLTASAVTDQWVDWKPLFDPSSLFDRGVFKAFSVVPFLLFVVVTLGMLVALRVIAGKENMGSALAATETKSDLVMEALIPLMLAPLVLRFQRMILFAAPALVPILAFLIQRLAGAVRERFPGIDAISRSRQRSWMTAGLAFVWVLLATLLFYKAIFVRYLPGNPLDPQLQERPLAAKLMTSNLSRDDVIQFMTMNRIQGRTFTSLLLSNYVLFNIPDVRLFCDLRAQSVYPDRVIQDYVSVVTARPETVPSAVAILDRFAVPVLILDTSVRPQEFMLAQRLMETREFACVYKDHWVVILASVQSERFGPSIKVGDLDALWYGRPETKIVSQAFLSHFMHGHIPPQLFDRLIATLKDQPDPDVYGLIVLARNGRNVCLNDRTRTFLSAEAERLASMDYMVTGGARTILASLLGVLHYLDMDETLCHGDTGSRKYALLKQKYFHEFQRIKAGYGGF